MHRVLRASYSIVALVLLLNPCFGPLARTVEGAGKAPEQDLSLATQAMARLDLARKTLAFVEADGPRLELASKLTALAGRIENAAPMADSFPPELYEEVCKLRREIILSHSLLDFDRLLINKRPPPKFNHQTDQYLGRHSGIGDGLVTLESWKDNPQATVLLKDQLPAGSVLHPDLSYDGNRILFSYCDHTVSNPVRRRFFIYEMDVNGGNLRQITGTKNDPMIGGHDRNSVMIEDWDPCYLPDGGFAFVSTRNQGGVRCHFGDRYCPTYTLYRGELNGDGIRAMAFGEANEWDPAVMHDGRIIWTRWDYINRHDTLFQSLWTTRPDGTSPEHFYGNYTRNPCSIAEARPIPGSHKIVATATAHHSYTAGSIIVIDPMRGRDGAAPLERITPEVAFPETEGWPQGAYATPWPLSENLFLVAYSSERHTSQGKARGKSDYAIYLVDTLGGRELIYRDDQMACFSPIPVRERPQPPALPSHHGLFSSADVATAAHAGAGAEKGTDCAEASGLFYVRNVYQSRATIEPGTIKSLRVVRVDSQTTQAVPPRSHVLFETAKKILGTVPVAEDGSVAFRAPAGESLSFQLLDKNGMAVMGMRTFTYLHPGEKIACVGCHERPNAPNAYLAFPEDVTIHEIEPPKGPEYEGGLSFVRTVQPVLDRHCIGCHGVDEVAGGIDLVGTIPAQQPRVDKLLASTAYNSLVTKKGLVSMAIRNAETDFTMPKDYYSPAGQLAKMLLHGDKHHKPLDRESLELVVGWLDMNAQFYGEYSWNKDEWRQPDPQGEKALRDHIRNTFGDKLAEQPYATLVNLGLPSESRVLKMGLSKAAGGWEQTDSVWTDTNEAGYQAMKKLVLASIKPKEAHDFEGTCNREQCLCRSCWVRKMDELGDPSK